MSKVFGGGDDGKKAAKESAARQKEELARQQAQEKRKTAEATDEIARRKAIATKGGSRASLLATSETGVQSAEDNGLKPKTAKKMGG